MRARFRAAPLLLALALALVLPAGCVRLPTSGAVHAGSEQQQVVEQSTLDFTPAGPEPGATRMQIVENFLTAMTAAPLSTTVARQFLTEESSRSWVPEKATVVYGVRDLTRLRTGVRLELDDVTRLDSRGRWLGDPTGGKGLRWRLRLVRQGGEWRISDPPDALVIPRTYFQDRFAQYFLYYFDKSGQVLVPEPVYVPRGAQAPTQLVSGLLRGPDQDLLGVERTYLPTGTRLDDLSVPIDRDGTADVPLSDQVLNLDHSALAMAFAQLAWTLRQVPGVERMRVTVDGTPLDLPGEAPQVRVDAWSEYDPAVAWASSSLFGLRGGRVVSWDGKKEHRVAGPFGARSLGLRTLAVDLPAEHVAGVSDDGHRVLVAPTGGTSAAAGAVTTVYQGYDVLRPSYDLDGRLWIADRTPSGARLTVVHKGDTEVLDAPGISGQDVRAILLSRDGTRLVAVLHTHAGDQLWMCRVRRTAQGTVRGLAAARQVGLGPTAVRVQGLGWRTPGTIALLTPSAPGTWQVVVVRMDGSSADGATTTEPGLFRGRALGLATAPLAGAPLYVAAGGDRLFTLAPTGRWIPSGVTPGLRQPTFVG